MNPQDQEPQALPPGPIPIGADDIVKTLQLALKRGYTAAEILDENSPIRERIEAYATQEPQRAEPADIATERDNWKRWCEDAEKTAFGNLLSWAVDHWISDVKHRPMVNIYRPGMDKVYRTLVRHLGGEPDELLGPEHKARVAAGEPDELETATRKDVSPSPEPAEPVIVKCKRCNGAFTITDSLNRCGGCGGTGRLLLPAAPAAPPSAPASESANPPNDLGDPRRAMDDDELQDFCIALSFEQDDYTVEVIRAVETRMLDKPLFTWAKGHEPATSAPAEPLSRDDIMLMAEEAGVAPNTIHHWEDAFTRFARAVLAKQGGAA